MIKSNNNHLVKYVYESYCDFMQVVILYIWYIYLKREESDWICQMRYYCRIMRSQY